MKYFEEQVFKNDNNLEKGDYEYCSFENCDFSGADLKYFTFVDCTFIECNLSSAKVIGTAFRNTTFNNCKLMGINFESCNPLLFDINCEGSQINFCTFYQMSLKKSIFKSCTMHEVDFTETNLSESAFPNCDLKGTHFERTILLKTDFRTSFNFSIDPENNQMKGARFSKESLSGLLNKYQIKID